MNLFKLIFYISPSSSSNTGSGDLVLSFTINEKGRATNPIIVKGLSEDINQAALDIIYKLPKFIPGKVNGKNSATEYTLNLNLILNLSSTKIMRSEFK